MSKPHYRRTAGGTVLPAVRPADGFQNVVANLGTTRDKAAANGYVIRQFSDQELLDAYRSSSVAKAVIDYPAEDSCREWREWQAEADDITKLEAEEKRLGLVGLVLKARKRARLYGGAAIYIGTGDNDTMAPLDPERIGKGGVRFLTLFDKRELSVVDLQMDPSEPGYGEPAFYRITGSSGQTIDVHPSRLVILRGVEVPDNHMSRVLMGWGDSELQATLEKITHLDGTLANVASLVFEAKVDVIKIANFTSGLRDGGAAYEQLMLRRFGLAATAKGINGALLLDSEEDYSQKSANFSTLPEIMDRFMQMVSAASGIPMTRLFGMSPAGMNATGESDLRNYYDRVRQEQTLDMEPAMGVLDECLIRSALGTRPEELHYNWRPLWQMSETDRADVATKLVAAAEGVQRMEAAPTEAIGKSIVNVLTEIGAFPGLETAVAEFETAQPQGGEVDPLTGDPIDRVPATASDAAPRTLYVRRDVLNADEILAWAKKQGFPSTLAADDLHVTIVYSRTPVDWMKVGQSWDNEVTVAPGGPRLMEQFGEARVLLFASEQLQWRHEQAEYAGASWDHDEYQPHITISYDPNSPDLADVQPYTGRIVLGPEIFEEVDSNWAPRETES